MGLGVNGQYRKQDLVIEDQEEYTPFHPTKGYGWAGALPEAQGLYDPQLEKDACGVGFAACVFLPSPKLIPPPYLTHIIAISRAKRAIRSSAMVRFSARTPSGF